MRRCVALVLVSAILVAPPSRAAAQQSREPFAGFDAYVNAALKTWKVPGAAVAIVRNDSVIYAKGYGVREFGKTTPVDERTMFAIGSIRTPSASYTRLLVDMMRSANVWSPTPRTNASRCAVPP